MTPNAGEGSTPLGIGRRATFLIGYAVVAVLVVLALRELLRASDVLENSPNADEAHIVARLSCIWLSSAIAAAIVVVLNHFAFMARLSGWLLAQLTLLVAVTLGLIVLAKQTPQYSARLLEVAGQRYVVPREFDPRSGEASAQRFLEVAICMDQPGGYFIGSYAPDCMEPDDLVKVVLRPFSVMRSAGIAHDLDGLKIPHLSGKVVDLPNTIDIQKFSIDGFRGFSFRTIFLHHVILDEDGLILLHASCDSQQRKCQVTRDTELGSLTYEIAAAGTLELEKWNAAAARYLELFNNWSCDGDECEDRLVVAEITETGSS